MALATTPIEERHVYHDAGTSSAASVVLLILAVAIIAGLTLYALQAFPFQRTAAPAGDNGASINIDAELPTPTPTPTPDTDVNVNP